MRNYDLKNLFIIVGALYCIGVPMAIAGINYNIDDEFYVPKSFAHAGKLFITGNGSINGQLLDAESLHIGKDIFGKIVANNFVTKASIGGIPVINIYDGSSFTSMHSISGVSKSFNIQKNANVAINHSFIGAGTVTNNGTLTLGESSLFYPKGDFYNHGDLNIIGKFVVPDNFVNTGSVYLVGNTGGFQGVMPGSKFATLHIGSDSSGKNRPTKYDSLNCFENMSLVHIYAGSSFKISSGNNFTLNTLFVGDGELINYGTLTVASGGSISTDLYNFNALNVQSDLIISKKFVNSGDIFVVGKGSIIGNLEGGASLNIGIDSNNIVNEANYISKGMITNISKINVYAGGFTTNIGNHIYGLSDSLNIFTGANATLNGEYFGAGTVNNYGSLIINKKFHSGLVTNQSTGFMRIAGSLTAPDLDNFGTLFFDGDAMGISNSFANYGTLCIQGNRQIIAASYISPGMQHFNIHSDAIYDSLVVYGDVDLANGGEVVVNSRFLGKPGSDYSWSILSGNTLVSDDSTKVNIPASTIHKTWTQEVTDKAIKVGYTRECLTTNIEKGSSLDVARILEAMACNPENDGHACLLDSICGCMHHDHYDEYLKKLTPGVNVVSNYRSIHNTVFGKVENRIAKVQDSSLSKRGVAAGDLFDLTDSTAVWVAGFGSVANQKAISGNAGYRATALGTIIGMDALMPNDDIYGCAIAISNSNVNEAASLDTKTRILGYNILLYGNNYFHGNNFFEWLLTGIINKNKGVRDVSVNNVNLNVDSSYRNFQLGGRINIGKNIDFYNWGIGQVNTLQYSWLHQPSYNENGSPAALHISEYNSNILTIGSGLRAFCRTNPSSPLVAKPAVHAMVTYDALSSNPGITSNFIIGSSDFSISQNPSRLAFKLGFDMGCEIYDNWQFQISYDLELRNRYSDNSAEIKLKYLF